MAWQLTVGLDANLLKKDADDTSKGCLYMVKKIGELAGHNVAETSDLTTEYFKELARKSGETMPTFINRESQLLSMNSSLM